MNYFQIAWDMAKKADKIFGYWGGAKQYFNEALKMAHDGYTEKDMFLNNRSLFLSQNLAGSKIESYKNLNEDWFLLSLDNGNQVIFNTYKAVLFPVIDESVTLSWKTETMSYKQDLPLVQALKELNRFEEINEANILWN